MEPIAADDIVRVRLDTLIKLHRSASQLPLKSKRIHSRLSGNYISTFKGRGMEFDEARPYQPGDDVRSIDWRVTARTGKTHTKLYREERERPVLLWVDLRPTMFFASQGMFKAVLAAKAAALLAWSSSQHNDRIGGLVFSEQQHIELRPQRGKAATLHFLKQLAGHPAWNKKETAHTQNQSANHALHRLRNVTRPGSLIFLISDFRDFDKKTESNLAQLAKNNDLVMLFISDPLEQQLPPAGYYKITDGTKDLAINTYNKDTRKQYQQRFAQHQQHLKDLCNKLGIFYIQLSTNQPLIESLQRGLNLRSQN
ncbi:hypothetical protein PA3071 [hydrothermal vent metagenome]|uniref:DUF58 domain-containing protein n=1 Tax=hydrothermal vent metagenome TaxID=652676 RepID=A0A3B1A467_9ZZZZ